MKLNPKSSIAPYNIFTFLYLFAFLFFSCATSATAEDPTSAIRSQWDQFIEHWQAERAAELSGMYTVDGVNVPPGFKVNRGREEIEAFYDMLFQSNTSSKYGHSIHSLSHEGNFAVEYGEFQVEWIHNDGTEWNFKSRSVTHWLRGEDGDWRINLFIFNQPPSED
jgi:uncharacterized protein (TIGR02246 family)